MIEAAKSTEEGVIYDLPQSFLKEWNDRFLKTIPDEKAQAEIRQAEIAKQMDASKRIEGLGQLIGRVDARIFFRWWQQEPGCWRDEGFIKKFLKDNPNCRAAGYRI